MKLYYRISDNSYKKTKLIGASKESCLMNFVKVFHETIFGSCNEPPKESWVPPMTIIADNCEAKTQRMLAKTGIPTIFTNFGNAGSLKHALQLSIENCCDDDIVYFCEDDYLHLPIAPKLIEEGIKRADYITLYDHPDKYTAQYNGGEFSKVIKTDSSHWRYTISTCMTFAAKVKTLKEDLSIWQKHTSENHPHDHQIFSELNKEQKRRLGVCIPGAACHTDLEFSTRMKKNFMEKWAIELMINDLEFKLPPNLVEFAKNKTGLERLIALDAISQG